MAADKEEQRDNMTGVDTAALGYMLTTVDNPWDPFTQFDQWYSWDISHGYHSAAFLARVVITSEDLSDADQYQAVQTAIDEIVRENVSGMHTKVLRDSSTADQ